MRQYLADANLEGYFVAPGVIRHWPRGPSSPTKRINAKAGPKPPEASRADRIARFAPFYAIEAIHRCRTDGQTGLA